MTTLAQKSVQNALLPWRIPNSLILASLLAGAALMFWSSMILGYTGDYLRLAKTA